jgi:hypothetical protein
VAHYNLKTNPCNTIIPPFPSLSQEIFKWYAILYDGTLVVEVTPDLNDKKLAKKTTKRHVVASIDFVRNLSQI